MMDPVTVGALSIAAIFLLILLGFHIGVALAAVSFTGVYLITGKCDGGAEHPADDGLQRGDGLRLRGVPALRPDGALRHHGRRHPGPVQCREAQFFLGRVKGGMGIATVIANAVFAAITGVSVASAAVFSKIAYPEMKRLKYDEVRPGDRGGERDPRDADSALGPDDRLRRGHRAVDRKAVRRRHRPRAGGDRRPVAERSGLGRIDPGMVGREAGATGAPVSRSHARAGRVLAVFLLIAPGAGRDLGRALHADRGGGHGGAGGSC